VQTTNSDALGIHQYFAALGTNIDKQSPFGGIGYAYIQYLNVAISRSLDFSAEVNKISSYLIEEQLEIVFHLPILEIQSQWDLFAGIATTKLKQGFYARENYNQTSELKMD